MKKTKLINSEISYTISKMGHTDSLTIGDCGLPIPEKYKRIDLALKYGCTNIFRNIRHDIRRTMCRRNNNSK